MFYGEIVHTKNTEVKEMSDNKGREIKFVYPISYDAAYCIYDTNEYGDFVYTTYTWCGKFTKMTKNKVYFRNNGTLYIKKYGKRVNLDDFIRID